MVCLWLQALEVPSVDKLDEKLSSMLLEGMPTGGFRALQCESTPEKGRTAYSGLYTGKHPPTCHNKGKTKPGATFFQLSFKKDRSTVSNYLLT